MGKFNDQISLAIKELKGLNLNIEDQSHPVDYVSVNIKHHKDGTHKVVNIIVNH